MLLNRLGSWRTIVPLSSAILLKSCHSAQCTTKALPPTDLTGKVVLITGASAGIGESCAWKFAEKKANLILLGRRKERLNELKKKIESAHPSVKIHTVSISVTDAKAVRELPSSLPAEFSNVYALVNNAGLALGVTSVENNSVEDAATVINTNVLGTIAICSAFLPGMKERGEGHLINMGSVAGHYAYPTGSVYNASKYAILGFTEAARHDLIGTPIRVTHISPGMVGNTEFSNVRLGDDAKAQQVYANIVPLHPDDVADTVVFAATRPPNVQVAEIMTYCTNQSAPREVVRAGPSFGKPQK